MCSSSAGEVAVQIVPHPRIPDVLLLPVDGPRYVRNAGATSDQSALRRERIEGIKYSSSTIIIIIIIIRPVGVNSPRMAPRAVSPERCRGTRLSRETQT